MCSFRLTNDESSQDKSIGLSKDTDMPEAEGKQFKKLGKCRSRIIKADFPIDCGVEADGDQNGQGVPSSREEKVSSLKTVSYLLIWLLHTIFMLFIYLFIYFYVVCVYILISMSE